MYSVEIEAVCAEIFDNVAKSGMGGTQVAFATHNKRPFFDPVYDARDIKLPFVSH